MAAKTEPSYADLVHEVLRAAPQPLTFQELFDAVQQRRPVTTRNPKATVRNVLTQGTQLVSLGDGRYGYLPHLVRGSVVRVPFTARKPAREPLIYPSDVRQALWPSFLDIQKRSDHRPARLRLPGGDEVSLPLDFFGAGTWGAEIPEALRRYLIASGATAGDALLIRVLDGEAGLAEAWFESRRKRDKTAVARRNQELADLAYDFMRGSRSAEVPDWDLAIALLGRGAYRADVAPDPLETVLQADARFVDAGLSMWILAETVTPEMRALIRRRQQLEREWYEVDAEPLADLAPEPSVAVSRYRMEQMMADVGALLAEQEFASVEEANAFLQDALARGGIPRRTAQTPLEEAQELMYRAWEASSARERIRLARRALEVSADCADAYVLLAEETARSAREAANLYAQGVAAGERALGPAAFEEAVGHFWGILETRPYMRARLGLAHALRAMGQQREATAHLWEMLRLNPGDNQGVRYLLLSWLLESGDDMQVSKLLDRYPDDIVAVWAYGRALHAFRTEGDTARARALRAQAKEANPHAPAYLTGRKRLPRRLPEMVGFGDESEAIICADEQAAAWRKTPGALAWLGHS